MMSYFCEVGTLWQIILLVLSLLTVIILVGSCTLSFRYNQGIRKQLRQVALFLLNSVLYIMMQVDSRITGAEHKLHLPCVLVFLITAVSFAIGVWLVLLETKNRKTINNTSIKEAFDNLPTGVCFFNKAGLPVLCNLTMHRFLFAVCGNDIQFITDLQKCLEDGFIPIDGVVRDGKIFTLKNGKAWQLERRWVTDEYGEAFTQFVVFDVTDLQANRIELTEENEQLRRTQAELQRLSANVVTVTREEEILNTKMRVHDEMGRCLVEARKYLCDNSESIPEGVVHSWKRAVSMLKYNNETDEEDMMCQIRKTCQSLGIELIQSGELPKNDDTAYLLTCAVRECVTNAVRYAQASELYAEFTEDEDRAEVSVMNNGKQPEKPISEGGGLSTLRKRIERSGGVMTVQSFPRFKLTVSVPKKKGGIL